MKTAHPSRKLYIIFYVLSVKSIQVAWSANVFSIKKTYSGEKSQRSAFSAQSLVNNDNKSLNLENKFVLYTNTFILKPLVLITNEETCCIDFDCF